ncbi:MAG: DUF362 domain-containing protein [Pseudomonadota bacterium]
MNISSTSVAILKCPHYDRKVIKDCLTAIFQALPFTFAGGASILLKPNLVSGMGHRGLACSHPEFVAAAAEWFVDHGARVSVGDSPAFGRAPAVMDACGISGSLKGLPVRKIHFNKGRMVTLASGLAVKIADEALDCDHLINLPRVKAHSQTLVTLAVKNYFGTVKGFSKAILHQRLGGKEDIFARMLVDVAEILPDGVSIIDGIEAMHRSGPMDGEPFPLGVVAGAKNPVALDSAMLEVLGVNPEKSLVWRETRRRNLAGWRDGDLVYPLLRPDDVAVTGFVVPERLKPIPFLPLQVLRSILKRIRAQL